MHPGLKVLYMSGYPDDVIAHEGILHKGINFIQKPFTVLSLIEKTVLDSKGSSKIPPKPERNASSHECMPILCYGLFGYGFQFQQIDIRLGLILVYHVYNGFID